MPGGTTVPYKKTKHKTFNAFYRKAASGQYQAQGRDRGSQGVSSAGVRKAEVQGHRAGAQCRVEGKDGVQRRVRRRNTTTKSGGEGGREHSVWDRTKTTSKRRILSISKHRLQITVSMNISKC